ncbi:hypothetical protein HDE68_000590 [Pedobacter cryoconitis]|uniref:Uncharacterized protein n=1 Tax=Pedobacter cryoconitis TaxID=188932 RepID=A0A7W9DYN1_9SPHI|nr:hypothetical protein [Pedobacter cryoconitis]MBB5634705.1 hypothetical protein [Pedobacter cryoconitis]
MEQIVKQRISDSNIFTEKAIYFGTYLGGPLTSGYLFAENFKLFGEPEKARKALLYGIITTIALITAIYFLPIKMVSKTPYFIIPIIYTSIAQYIFQRSQKNNTIDYISNGGKAFSLWRVFAISLIGAAVTIIPFLGYNYLSARTNQANEISITNGPAINQLNFDKRNIPATEIHQIAEGLNKIGFFDAQSTKSTYVKKVGLTYEISISCTREIEKTSYSFTPLINWRNKLQSLFPKNQIVFVLVVDDLDHVIKRLE